MFASPKAAIPGCLVRCSRSLWWLWAPRTPAPRDGFTQTLQTDSSDVPQISLMHKPAWHIGLKKEVKKRDSKRGSWYPSWFRHTNGARWVGCSPSAHLQCFPVRGNLWHGAFGNQTAHTARARSAPCVGKSGQASGKSARFPPRASQQIVLPDVGHPADKASGSVDL